MHPRQRLVSKKIVRATSNANLTSDDTATLCQRRQQGAEEAPADGKMKEDTMRQLIFLTAGLLVPALVTAQLDPVWVST